MLMIIIFLSFFIYTFGATPKQNCIKRIRTQLSDYLTEAQLGKAMDGMFTDGYNNLANFNTALDNFINTVMGTLTNAQMMTAMNILGGLNSDLGSDDASNALDKVMEVIEKTLMPNAKQILNKIQQMKKSKKTKNQCIAQGYVMMNTLFTPAKTKQIFQRIKGSMSAKWWNAIRNRMGTALKFSKFGM